MQQREIIFTEQKAKQFEAAYRRAVEHHAQMFRFDGCEVLTVFAGYVLQFLRSEGFLETKH